MNNQNMNENLEGAAAAPAAPAAPVDMPEFPNLLSDFNNLLTELDHLLTAMDDDEENRTNARIAYSQLYNIFHDLMAEGGIGVFDEAELANLPENIRNHMATIRSLVAENEDIFNEENEEWGTTFSVHHDAAWYFYDQNGFDEYIDEAQNQLNNAIANAAQQGNQELQQNLVNQIQAILAGAALARLGFPAGVQPEQQGGRRKARKTRKARKISRKANKASRKARRSRK